MQQSPLASESSEQTPEGSRFNSAQATATEIQHRSTLADPEVESQHDSISENTTKIRSNHGLPSFLQPWDTRKRNFR